MNITKQVLIDLCDRFLNGNIDKCAIIEFASKVISSRDSKWEEDEILSETILDWDNEDLNFEINKTNIQLWKNRLLTGKDDLISYNFWNSHIESQKVICTKYNSKWNPVNKRFKIGVSANLNIYPINGLRHQSENGTTGWYIWGGEYSEEEDFFQPICAEHLLQKRPDLVKYLGLDIGFRFLIDNNGYEDVWYDKDINQ